MKIWIICIVLLSTEITSQTFLDVTYKSGNPTNSTDLNLLQKLTFSQNDILFHFNDNSTASRLISEIDRIYFSLTSRGSTLPVENSTVQIPDAYQLFQNYPNPFNPSTIIRYNLPAKAFVSIKVYDILGRETCVLVNEIKEAGAHSSLFDASAFSSGVYLCKMVTSGYYGSFRMILSK